MKKNLLNLIMLVAFNLSLKAESNNELPNHKIKSQLEENSTEGLHPKLKNLLKEVYSWIDNDKKRDKTKIILEAILGCAGLYLGYLIYKELYLMNIKYHK